MLCGVCLRAFSSAEPIPRTPPEDAVPHMVKNDRGFYQDPQWIAHHPSFLSLKASADSHYLICAAFWNQQETSVIAEQLESEISSSTNLSLAVSAIQPGTKVGINTWIELPSEPASGAIHSVQHTVMVNGFPPDNPFREHISVVLEPKGARDSTS